MFLYEYNSSNSNLNYNIFSNKLLNIKKIYKEHSYKEYLTSSDINIIINLNKNININIIKNDDKIKQIINLTNYNDYYSINTVKEFNITDEIGLMSTSGVLYFINWFNGFPIDEVKDKQFLLPDYKINLLMLVTKCIIPVILLNVGIINKFKDSNYNISSVNAINSLLNIIFLNYTENIKTIEKKANHPIFIKQYYNFYKTKDNRYYSFGNIENKFKKDFAEKIKNYNINFNNYNELEKLFKSMTLKEMNSIFNDKKNCASPVLNYKEAFDLFKHLLNKQIDVKNNKEITEIISYLDISKNIQQNNKKAMF